MEQTHPPLQIGMLLYPGLTLLDLFSPQIVFSWFRISTFWGRQGISSSRTLGLAYSQPPRSRIARKILDILFVPAGWVSKR